MTDNTLLNHCLLWALHIDEAGDSRPLTISELCAETATSGYTWIHIQADTLDTASTLAQIGLQPSIIEALCVSETRPRALQFENGMLIYLRGINHNPQADPEDMVSLRVWVTDRAIVTARRRNRKLLSIQDVKDNVDSGQAPNTSVELLLSVIGRIAERINETVDSLDEELTQFESMDKSEKNDRLKLSLVRRQAAALRRYLAPQRDALDTIYRFNKSITSEQAFDLRDQADRMTRYVEDLDLAKERAMVLQDELRNRIAEQQGLRMYVLSLVTAIFLPLSFLTGVFGMNVGGLPGIDNPAAFNVLTGCMLFLALLILIYMIRKKWF
jgi:zinc transporter